MKIVFLVFIAGVTAVVLVVIGWRWLWWWRLVVLGGDDGFWYISSNDGNYGIC